MVTTVKATLPAAPTKAAPAVPAKLAAPSKPAATAKQPALKKVVKTAVVKTAATAIAKPAVKAVTKPKAAKPVKDKKPKLVRDSFTIPKAEYSVLAELKQRAGKLGSPIKKSELLRAGIKALAAMADSAFVAALKAVPAVKTGRPAKD
jgi:hypothetical protein